MSYTDCHDNFYSRSGDVIVIMKITLEEHLNFMCLSLVNKVLKLEQVFFFMGFYTASLNSVRSNVNC